MPILATSTAQALLDLINRDNDCELTFDDVKFSTITAISGATEPDQVNAYLDITGVDKYRYSGSVRIKWCRRVSSEVLGESNLFWYNPEATLEDVQKWFEEVYLQQQPIPFDKGSYYMKYSEMAPDDPNSRKGTFKWRADITFYNNHIIWGGRNLFICTDHLFMKDVLTKTTLSGFTELMGDS